MMMMMSVYSEYQCVCVILHMSVITQNGWSALTEAAMKGESEAVVELVKAGANVDMQNAVRTCTYMYVLQCMYMYTIYTYICTCILYIRIYVHVYCMYVDVHTCTNTMYV